MFSLLVRAPAGLILGAALGSRGISAISIDRDPGPSAAAWQRRGVMQLAHAHNFRPHESGRVRGVILDGTAVVADLVVDRVGSLRQGER